MSSHEVRSQLVSSSDWWGRDLMVHSSYALPVPFAGLLGEGDFLALLGPRRPMVRRSNVLSYWVPPNWDEGRLRILVAVLLQGNARMDLSFALEEVWSAALRGPCPTAFPPDRIQELRQVPLGRLLDHLQAAETLLAGPLRPQPSSAVVSDGLNPMRRGARELEAALRAQIPASLLQQWLSAFLADRLTEPEDRRTGYFNPNPLGGS